MRDFEWCDAEQKVARQAFDTALKKEHAAVLARLKALAAKAEHPEDIWAIHDYLSEQRRMIDAKYDYRYSQLIVVFGTLLREKWINDKVLECLGEEKLQAIRHIAAF